MKAKTETDGGNMEIENHDSHITPASTAAKLTQFQEQKEPSKAPLFQTLQAHPSIGKDYLHRWKQVMAMRARF
jgi:hypothetical protein